MVDLGHRAMSTGRHYTPDLSMVKPLEFPQNPGFVSANWLRFRQLY